MKTLDTRKLGIYHLNSTDENGKIKVVVLHKPQIGNIWIELFIEPSTAKDYDKHNMAKPKLASFKDYKSYLRYAGSEEFQALFEIVEFKY